MFEAESRRLARPVEPDAGNAVEGRIKRARAAAVSVFFGTGAAFLFVTETGRKRFESFQSVTFHLIWVAAIAFVCASFLRQWELMTAGLAVLGVVLIVHAGLSFLIIRYWYKSGVSFANSFDTRVYFAIVQLVIGIASVIGVIGELTTKYLSSGIIGKDIGRYSVIEIGIGLFFLLPGILMLSCVYPFFREGIGLKSATKEGVLMLIQGIGYSIVGLLITAVFVYEMISRLLKD